eukprot:5334768-Prymnesium_polylepis.1
MTGARTLAYRFSCSCTAGGGRSSYMACWICETRAPPGAAHDVNDCSAHMGSCTAKALAGAGIESF